MSLERKDINWSCQQISKMIDNGKLSFEHVVQRSYVWEPWRRSYFIDSILAGYPMPIAYAKRDEDKKYAVLDGKQHFITVHKFISDQFALVGLKETVIYDEVTDEKHVYDLNGKKFSQLPENLQNDILNRRMTIYYYENITPEEEKELFKRINSGKPLSVKEKNIANCKDIEHIMEIGEHEIFKDMLTKKGMESRKYIPLIIKMYMMLTKPISEITFEGKKFNTEIENIEIADEYNGILHDLLEMGEYVHDLIAQDGNAESKRICKRIYTETHFVSLVPFMQRAIDENIDWDICADWMMKFFMPENETTVSELYNSACKTGTAKPENIQKRHNALLENFEQFFNKASTVDTE